MKFTIGADPEFFLSHKGKPFSGVGIIPGTKKNPAKTEKGAIQLDGLAAEFNIDPAHSRNEFVANINTVLKELRKIVPKKFDFAFTPTAVFDEAHFKAQPLAARRLGCDPDFNAYSKTENPIPRELPCTRTASGHIHVGWTKGADINNPAHFETCTMLTKQLDVALGIPSVLYDSNTVRRQMYGKAGAFRPKPYGFEYRVLSNFWLTEKKYTEWVFDATLSAMRKAARQEFLFEGLDEELIQSTINQSNVQEARKIIEKLS